MNIIAMRLRELRDRFHFSQEAFLSRGITQKTVSNWEKGETPQNFEWLATLANQYETSADYILGITDNPAPSSRKRINSTLEVGESGVPYETLSPVEEVTQIMWSLPEEKQRAIVDIARVISNMPS